MITTRIALAACLGLLGAGCSPPRDEVAGLSARRAALPLQASRGACAFHVTAIDDQREAQDLGHLGSTRIDGKGFADWFADGIASIPGYTQAQAQAPAPTTIRIQVLKAYMQGLATLKSAHLVVRLQIVSEGLPTAVHTYRGVDGSMNWRGAEGEIQSAFDRALLDLRAQIAADLQQRCKA